MKELYFFDETFYWGRSGKRATVIEAECELTQDVRHENWEIISCENGKMVNKAFLRHADGTTYTITAHLTRVEKE